MNNNAKMATVGAAALVVGLIVGGALGQRQGWGMGKTFLEQETTGMLNFHVTIADAIRRGDSTRALTLLDAMIATAKANGAGLPRAAEPAK